MVDIRRPKDFGAGLLFVGIGSLSIYIARDYELGTARAMGPGYFPILLSGVLICLGALLLGRSFFGEGESITIDGLRPLILVLGASLLFGLLLEPAGLLISIALMVVFGSLAESGFRSVQALLLAIVLAVVSWIVFSELLGQQLPAFGSWLAG